MYWVIFTFYIYHYVNRGFATNLDTMLGAQGGIFGFYINVIESIHLVSFLLESLLEINENIYEIIFSLTHQ